VADQKNHEYVVRSLYFDDPFYTCFSDKVEGVHTRSKFRVRTYTKVRSVKAPQFLEIKGRYNNLVLKHRTPIGDGSAIKDHSGERLVQNLLGAVEPSKVSRRFEFELYRKRLRAVALIDYARRPYISRFDPEFRLTFDSALKATQTSALFPAAGATKRSVLPGYTVMEVKFRRHIPSWFHRLIQAYELRRVSVSKICRGMEALGMAQDI
jgi:hypothetical protein